MTEKEIDDGVPEAKRSGTREELARDSARFRRVESYVTEQIKSIETRLAAA